MERYLKGSLSLEVQELSDNEALQLLQKKLKQPDNTDDQKLIDRFTWTPLTVELAAASLNQGLKPVSEFIDREHLYVTALYSLLAHLSSFERHLLCFVSCFRPPEIPTSWIRSFIEWRQDDEELDELAAALRRLTELSLLTHVSVTNAYKMHEEVQAFVMAWLHVTDRRSQFFKNIKSCGESRKVIPSHRLLDAIIPWRNLPIAIWAKLDIYLEFIAHLEANPGGDMSNMIETNASERIRRWFYPLGSG